MNNYYDQKIRRLNDKIELLTQNPDYRTLFEKYCLLEARLIITEATLKEKRLLESIAHAALDLIEGFNRWTTGDTEAKFVAMVEAAKKWTKESDGYILRPKVTLTAIERIPPTQSGPWQHLIVKETKDESD